MLVVHGFTYLLIILGQPNSLQDDELTTIDPKGVWTIFDAFYGLKYPVIYFELTAPFPAILFCFATINLLGALVTGRADRGADDKLISIPGSAYVERAGLPSNPPAVNMTALANSTAEPIVSHADYNVWWKM